MQPSCPRHEDGASAVVAVVLLVGIAVALGAAVAVTDFGGLRRNLEREANEAPPDTGLHAEHTDHYALQTLGPDVVPFAGNQIIVVADGVEATFPVAALAPQLPPGAAAWSPGEKVCIAGPAADCLLGPAGAVSVRLVAARSTIAELPPLPATSPAALPSPPPQAQPLFAIGPDGAVVASDDVQITLQVVGTQITYGSGGPAVPITMRYSENGGSSWSSLFGGATVAAGMAYTDTVAAGQEVGVSARAKYLSLFDRTYHSFEGNGHVLVLKDGDAVPAVDPFEGQAPLAAFLSGFVDVGAQQVSLQDHQVILLWEYTSNLLSAAADYQDLVVLLSFEPT